MSNELFTIGSNMSKKRWLWWSVLGVIGLYLLLLVTRCTPIQKDIQARTQAALNGKGYDWVTATAEGRDVTLTGIAPNEAAQTEAIATASSIYGARVVNNGLTIKEYTTPIFGLNNEDGKTILTGSLPEERLVNQALRAASDQFGADNVVNRMTVSDDVSTPTWLDSALALLPALTDMKDADFDITNDGATLNGTFHTDEDKAAFSSLATEKLSDTVTDNSVVVYLGPTPEELAEIARLAEEAEALKIAEEKRVAAEAEIARMAEEAKLVEAEFAKKAELAKATEAEKLAEEKRLAEIALKEAEVLRVAEEKRAAAEAEVARMAEETKLAEAEFAKKAELAKEAEAKRLADAAAAALVAEATKLADEKRLAEEAAAAKLAEETRLAEEAAAAKLAEEKRLAEEAAAAKLAEEKRLAEEATAAKLAEEKRLTEEAAAAKLAEEKRLAEEAAADKLAEEKRLAEEAAAAAKLAEEKRLAEEAAAAKLAEEKRLAEEAAELAEKQRIQAELVSCQNQLTEAMSRDSILFATSSASINSKSYPLLDNIATTARLCSDSIISNAQKIEISGHTDSRGADDMNLKLSESRAKSVRDYLLNKGVRGSLLISKGYGEANPIASNDTSAGRQENRRIQFTIQ